MNSAVTAQIVGYKHACIAANTQNMHTPVSQTLSLLVIALMDGWMDGLTAF